MKTWDDFEYWRSGEWQVVQEKLDDLEKANIPYCPRREDMFAALDAVDLEDVTVAIIGQDPYPDLKHATGIAFSIPSNISTFPPSLDNIFNELVRDLGIDRPKYGDLTKWTKQGVLLWNAYPTCLVGKPGSHHWTEWTYLTKEIIEELDKEKMIYVFLGRVAQTFSQYTTKGCVFKTSHPSPLGVNHGFAGSNIFSSINKKLVEWKQPKINWRL